MANQLTGWVRAGSGSFVFAGGPSDYAYADEFGLVQAAENLLQVTVMSDSRHVGVSVSLADEFEDPDTDRWDSIAETSVTFEWPPKVGRAEFEAGDNDAAPELTDLGIPAGTYRVRCSASGLDAAQERRLKGIENEPTPDDSAALLEQFDVVFVASDTVDPQSKLLTHFPDGSL